jgi:putative FmdB family regulatory protein
MPLFEFRCKPCDQVFEQITKSGEKDYGQCPKCKKKGAEKILSKFAVGGRGDLRESTMDGCHEPNLAPSSSKGGGHKHGSGCGHCD